MQDPQVIVTTEAQAVTPLVGPLAALLKSRKGLAALVYLVVAVVVTLVPELGEMQQFLGEVGVVVAFLIGGIALEDAASWIGSGKGESIGDALKNVGDVLEGDSEV